MVAAKAGMSGGVKRETVHWQLTGLEDDVLLEYELLRRRVILSGVLRSGLISGAIRSRQLMRRDALSILPLQCLADSSSHRAKLRQSNLVVGHFVVVGSGHFQRMHRPDSPALFVWLHAPALVLEKNGQ